VESVVVGVHPGFSLPHESLGLLGSEHAVTVEVQAEQAVPLAHVSVSLVVGVPSGWALRVGQLQGAVRVATMVLQEARGGEFQGF